jgi:hypothetical protein
VLGDLLGRESVRANAAWLTWTLLGCSAGDRGAVPSPKDGVIVSSDGAAAVAAAFADIPDDRTEVLAELAPVPGGAVVIVYDIAGPAGISGSLELLIAEGGYRRDNWRVSLPLPDGTREIRGSRVHTPELLWRGDDDDDGYASVAQLGASAAAIAELAPESRARVIAEIRGWRRELARARAEDPGTQDRIADIACTRVRAGAGEVCSWEELGVPLRYQGVAFTVTARHVERGARLGPSAFEIPAGAVRVASADLNPPRLAAIAAGDRAEILRLLRPEPDVLPELLPNG